MANNMESFSFLDSKDKINKNQIIEIVPILYDSGLKRVTYIYKCPIIISILIPIKIDKVFASLSNRIRKIFSHYQTPCMCHFVLVCWKLACTKLRKSNQKAYLL